MTIKEPVDQVQITWPATAGADRERVGQVRLRACREGGGLLVPHVDPVDRSFRSQCVYDAVERVPGDAVDAPNAGGMQDIDKQMGYSVRHGTPQIRCIS